MALSRTVDAIRATGREVLILEGMPEIGWTVPEGLVRRAQLRHRNHLGAATGRHFRKIALGMTQKTGKTDQP